jgi:hypothetical protein
MKKNINEHDKTKEMMAILRGGFKNRVISEELEQPLTEKPQLVPGDDLPEPEIKQDTISPKSGDSVFNDELKKLQDTVDPRVKINNFKIYPVDQNVIIEGVFLQRESEESGIHFKMSLSAGELQTSMQQIELDDKVSFVLQKLKGYYENWLDEWALKLANEYKAERN